MHLDEPRAGTNIVRFIRRKPRVCIVVTGACFSEHLAEGPNVLLAMLLPAPANTDLCRELIADFQLARLICVNEYAH